MNTKPIRSVLAVHQYGSIHKAAKVLHLAPSSVSAQIKELSAELGADIFIANGRNIVLSSVGHSLLPSFQAFIAQELNIREQAQQASQSLSGTMTLFAPSSMCIYRLPKIIGQLQNIAPGLELLLTHEPFDYDDALKKGDIDAAILVVDTASESFSTLGDRWSYKRLYSEEVIYVCHPQRYQPQSLSARELDQAPLITTEPACSYRQRGEQHFTQQGLTFTPRQSFTNVEVIKRCVLANMGVGLLPRCTVEAELQTGELMEQGVDGAPYLFASCLVARQQSSLSAKLAALWRAASH